MTMREALHPRPKGRGLPVPPHHSRTGGKSWQSCRVFMVEKPYMLIQGVLISSSILIHSLPSLKTVTPPPGSEPG